MAWLIYISCYKNNNTGQQAFSFWDSFTCILADFTGWHQTGKLCSTYSPTWMMFQHLRNKFGLTKSKTKITESIFVGPEICEWMSDDWFQMKLNPAQLGCPEFS